MGNACHHMLMEDSDLSVSARSTSSNRRRRSWKESCLYPSVSGFRAGSAKRASSLGADAYEDPISKGSSASFKTDHGGFAAADSFTSPKVRRRAGNLIIPREDLNKEADDFIAKMRGQMKIERKESEMEYLQRIQRGAM